ncbi:MAG: dihydrodipicolinate synthase family protein [Planctomycetota bacterium]
MFPKNSAAFITALGTPVDESGDLVEESFRLHVRHQLEHGIDGFLVSGSMGMMPALTWKTYIRSVEVAAQEASGKAKIMVGVGDNSLERTLERMKAVRDFPIDAFAATTPFYFFSSQKDLIHYFTKLADASPLPFYLYDLPQVTKVKIELPTMLELSKHPKIAGAKCSHEPAFVRQLFDLTCGTGFEVISAQYDLVDVFLRYGITMQLDGFFSVMPAWLAEIKTAYAKGDFDAVTRRQRKMTALRNDFLPLSVFPAFTVAMNLLGFPGRFHPSHMKDLDDAPAARVRKVMEEAGLLPRS